MGANSLEFDFLGEKIPLRTESDQETVEEILELVALKVRDAQLRIKSAPPHKIALIALLDLAEDYVRAKRKTAQYRAEFTEKSRKLVEKIEDAMK